MTLAWFRAEPAHTAGSLDETAAAIAHLQRRHDIEVITAAEAHDFVWRHARSPVDLCVFELDNDDRSAFVWPYLFRFPGLLVLSSSGVHNARAAMLERQGRHADYQAEFLFNEGHPPPARHKVLPRGSWPMLRAPIAASRLTVVRHATYADRLREQFPQSRIRHVPLGTDTQVPRATDAGGPLRCLVFGDGRADVVRRAAARVASARPIEIVAADTGAPLESADAVLALSWPPAGESLVPALAGMAAALPVVIFETEATAGWATIDPQTWRPRGFGPSSEPFAVALDPRDEEHSLMLALRRLVTDQEFGRALGAAARTWWAGHATGEHALTAWAAALEQGVSLDAPPKPPDWPEHLAADGAGDARRILGEFGVTVDFLARE